MTRTLIGICLLAGALVACANDASPIPADSPAETAPDPLPQIARDAPPPAAPTRSPLLIDGDLGGWTPSDELLERALRLGDPDRKAEALAELEALDGRARVDTLRAGIRLRDTDAAIACAARLEYEWIDNWECAKTVHLLTPEVLRPDTEADYELYRSYLGSVEVNALLDALVDALSVEPMALEGGYLMGQLHRVLRAEHILPLYRVAQATSGKLRESTLGNLGLLSTWSDRHRVETAAYDWDLDPADFPAPPADGLHPVLKAVLRQLYLSEGAEGLGGQESVSWTFRWMMDSRPGPQDVPLIIDLITAIDDSATIKDPTTPELLHLWLGLLPDQESEAFLRSFEGEEWDARIALARRGDAAEIAWLESQAHDGHVEFGVFLECAPERARKWLETSLLGKDEQRARDVLDRLNGYMLGPADVEPHLGITWRADLFDGFEEKVAAADIPPVRRGAIAVLVPGCRTRRLARQIAKQLERGFVVWEEALGNEEEDEAWSEYGSVGGFLETAAPVEFRRTLRGLLRGKNADDVDIAWRMLWRIGDPEAGPLLVAHDEGLPEALRLADGVDLVQLARSTCPEVIEFLRTRAAQAEPDPDGGFTDAEVALAAALGLPERAAEALQYTKAAPGAREALLDGRPVDALALQLAANPDEMFEVGQVRDPRVRAHLERLRRERHLGRYWPATAELALQDTEAREELWAMLQDGRYRPQDALGIFTRTLGHDLSTIPFWISELESQCCRINLGGGQIFDELFGVEDYHCGWSTSFRRVGSYWERHRGRFVWSHLAETFVPAPE